MDGLLYIYSLLYNIVMLTSIPLFTIPPYKFSKLGFMSNYDIFLLTPTTICSIALHKKHNIEYSSLPCILLNKILLNKYEF